VNNKTEYRSLEFAVKDCFGGDVVVERTAHVGGGDINSAACLYLSNGEAVFVKSNKIENRDLFAAEEQGLNAIAATNTIKTPYLIGRGVDSGRGIAFLMMEMLRGGQRTPDFWETFGRELAALHCADPSRFLRGGSFGFHSDNYIGMTPQRNQEQDTWIEFFRSCRLKPQIDCAAHYFDMTMRRKLDRLLDRLDDLLEEPKRPSLLHGDLWSGNYIQGPDGKAWLIDPAVYVGHYEADLAMTELFGGFSERFYSGYREIIPMEAGYKDRRDLYNLYHLLNHLNLFGAAYLPSVMTVVENYL